MALNNWFHSYAKKIEETASMDVKYEKAGEREIVINFGSKESLDKFDEELKKLQTYFKNIIGNIDLDNNKSGSEYVNELEKMPIIFILMKNYQKKIKKRS